MNIKKIILWEIMLIILLLFFTSRPILCKDVEAITVLELPSINKLIEDEIKKLEEEQLLKELEEERRRIRNNQLSPNRGDFKGRKYRIEKLIVTAYAPFDNKSGMCNDGDPSKTSTGTRPDWGTVAVNPKRFPYGTEFYIEGYPYKAVALDTGGAMRKNSRKIDLYMDTYEQAISWGKREIEVIVFEEDVD